MASFPSDPGAGGTPPDGLVPWERLDPERQLRLREAYGHHLDSQPPTCSLDEKVKRFSDWLATGGVRYP